MSRAVVRARFGDASVAAGNRLEGMSGTHAWGTLHSTGSLAPYGGLPSLDAGARARLSQGAFLLEFARAAGDSSGRMFHGSVSRVTTPTTRPITSASSGICQDSGTHRERGCGCIKSRAPA